jgi:hypothetical protein
MKSITTASREPDQGRDRRHHRLLMAAEEPCPRVEPMNENARRRQGRRRCLRGAGASWLAQGRKRRSRR